MLKSVDSCFQLWVVVYVVDRLWFRKKSECKSMSGVYEEKKEASG